VSLAGILAEALKEIKEQIKELRKEVNQMKSSHSHVYHHKDPPPPSPPIPFIPRFKKGDVVHVHMITCPVRRTPKTLSATVVRVSPSEQRRSDHIEGRYDVRLSRPHRGSRLFTTGDPHDVDVLGGRIIKNIAEDSITQFVRDLEPQIPMMSSYPYMPRNVVELN